jgi:hypothetical protein
MTAEYSFNETKLDKNDKARPSEEDYASFVLKVIGAQSRWDDAIIVFRRTYYNFHLA